MSEVDKQKHITNATEKEAHRGNTSWSKKGVGQKLAYHWLIQYLDDRYQYAHINNTDSGLLKGNLWGATGFTSWTTIVYIT